MRQHLSRRRTHTARRARRQPGYALLVVLLMFSVFVIFLATAVPSWKTEIQRDRENMEIDRAHQYVEGIKRYYHKFGSYPPNLERLKETNGIHYLRQAWPDPLTPDGKWKLLQSSDLKNGEVVGGGMGLPGGAMNRTRTGVGSTATGTSGSLFGGGLSMGSSLSGDTEGSDPGGGLFSGSEDSDASSGDTSGSSSTATAMSGNSTTSATSSTATSPTSSAGTSSDSSRSNRSGGLFGGTTGSTAGRTFGGAGIVGVASRSKKPAVHAFNHKHRPDQWQFVYNPMHDKSLLGPGVGNGPALGQQIGGQPGSTTNGSQGGGLFGSGTTGTGGTGGTGGTTGTTGTGGSTSSSGDTGAGSNPGAGLFGDSGSN